MKHALLIAAATLNISVAAKAQLPDFRPVLKVTFEALDTTQDPVLTNELSNKLVLIAKKNPGEWTTNYYAAIGRGRLSYADKDETKRDADIDEAEIYYNKAVQLLGKETDETLVLAAQIANMRLAVKPMMRYQKYGKIFEDDLDKAKELNPDNPRIYYLRGTSKFFTPTPFGGGAKAAAPYFEKAQTLFEKEAGGDITKPYWGKGANRYFLGQCAKKED